MKNLYLIPGLGADERLFERLNLKKHNVKHICWIKPNKHETLQEYVNRLTEQVDQPENVVFIGVSFGGLVAIELSKIIKPIQTIIISSIKNRKELPFSQKMIGIFKPHKIIPPSLVQKCPSLIRYQVGITSEYGKKLLDDLTKDTDIYFSQWAFDEFLKWDNHDDVSDIVHIHGTSDRVLPAVKINNFIPVKGGSHFMVVEQADEVSTILNDILGE